jgi:hypothetical protein
VRRVFAAIVLLVVARGATAQAGDDEDYGGGSIVYAHGTSLWQTDAEGHGPETELVTLPGAASDVQHIRSSPDGSVLLFDSAGTWYWAAVGATPATPTKLDCAAGDARISSDGTSVVCAAPDDQTLIVSLSTGKAVTRAVPPTGARLFKRDGTRTLVWADATGVWSATKKDLSDKTQLATEAPVGGFLASPDGSRAVALYPGHVFEHRQKLDANVFTSFLLDGTAARRTLAKDSASAIDWSWDSRYLLVQDGESACITRAVGGEYKCWKGYVAQSIAPDGRWALVLGDESHKLFRVRLEGPDTSKPSLVETVCDGGALWLPKAP